MNDSGEVSESRTVAILKEAAVTAEQERSAGITPYESVPLKRRISNKPIHDRRPGQ